MKKSAKIIAASAALYGLSAYGTAKLLTDIAMKRDPPRLPHRRESSRLTGETPNAAYRAAQRAAAKKLAAVPHEPVSIRSRDGLMLMGHWYACPNAKRIVIAFHGWRSSWYWDFGLLADFWRREGCSVLYVEQRAQMESQGAYIGFGLTERYDCLSWLRWVTDRCGTGLPIYLAGVSMGAATVLMAAGLDLPDTVHGIIADSAYTSLHAIWQHVARKNLHLPFLLTDRISDQICRKRLSFGSRDCSTTDTLAAAQTPVLLIHGEADHFVPVRMAYENYNACQSPCRLLVVPGADHTQSYYMDPTQYEDALRAFWSDFDGGAGAPAPGPAP